VVVRVRREPVGQRDLVGRAGRRRGRQHRHRQIAAPGQVGPDGFIEVTLVYWVE
jgi:hypothetical protein